MNKRLAIGLALMLVAGLLGQALAAESSGAMAGESAAVGEYLKLVNLDIRVDNWGYVTAPTKPMLRAANFFGSSKTFGSNENRLLRIDLSLKNNSKKPLHVFNQYFKGTVVAKDERSFNLETDAMQKFGIPQDFAEDILPGQPAKVSLYVLIAKDADPAKLVLRNPKWAADRVLRFFLQQNLPEELIAGTTRSIEVVEEGQNEQAQPAQNEQQVVEQERSEPTIVDEIKDETEKSVKRNVKNKTKREINKLIKF